jgi:hypothetical protein
MEILSEYIPSELLDRVYTVHDDYRYGKFYFIRRRHAYTFYYGNSKIGEIDVMRRIKRVTKLDTSDIQFLPYIDDKCEIYISSLSERIFRMLSNIDKCSLRIRRDQLKNFLVLSKRFGNLRVRKLHISGPSYRFINKMYLERISCLELCIDNFDDSLILNNTNSEIICLNVGGFRYGMEYNTMSILCNHFTNILFLHERRTWTKRVNEEHKLYNEDTKRIIDKGNTDELIDYYLCYVNRFNRTKSAAVK